MALGVCVLLGVFAIPIPPLWASAIFMIAGLSMLGPSEPRLQNIVGLVLLSTGTLLAFRAITIITTPWLRYGLGAVFVLGGFGLILHSVIGGTPKQEKPEDTNI